MRRVDIVMKKLGIIGGMEPESTLLYYKEIDQIII